MKTEDLIAALTELHKASGATRVIVELDDGPRGAARELAVHAVSVVPMMGVDRDRKPLSLIVLEARPVDPVASQPPAETTPRLDLNAQLRAVVAAAERVRDRRFGIKQRLDVEDRRAADDLAIAVDQYRYPTSGPCEAECRRKFDSVSEWGANVREQLAANGETDKAHPDTKCPHGAGVGERCGVIGCNRGPARSVLATPSRHTTKADPGTKAPEEPTLVERGVMEDREMLRAVRGLLDRAGVQAYSRDGQPLSTKERVHEVLVHVDELGDRIRELAEPEPTQGAEPELPKMIIPIKVWCPHCGTQHIDEERNGEKWHRRAHTTHRCQSCGGDFDIFVSGTR